MARTRPTKPGRTFPRWSVPLDKIPHKDAPKVIYEALAAGREDNWGAVGGRILRYSMRLADRGVVTRKTATGLWHALDAINDRRHQLRMA